MISTLPLQVLFRSSLSLLLTLAALPFCYSQTSDLPELELGKPVERELAGGQTHSYQVKLAAGQFCHVVVNQKGVDVVVEFHGPTGEKLTEVDGPNDVN